MEKDTRDIARGASTNFIGILIRSLTLVFYIVLGRLYGAEITGFFLLSRTTVDMLSKLGILGLDRAMLTTAAGCRAQGDDAGLYRAVGQSLTVGLGLSLAMATLIHAGAAPLAARLLDKPALADPLQIMGWSIPFLLVSAVCLFATRALRVMKYEVFVKSLVEPLSLLLFALASYRLGLGLGGLASAYVAATAIGAGFAVWFFSRKLSFARIPFFHFGGARHLFRLALPIGLGDLLNLLLQRIDMMMIGYYLPAATVGIYGLAQEAAFSIKKIRQSFDPIFLPVISGAHRLKHEAAMRLQYQNVTRWTLILGGALLGVIVFAAAPLMGLFGKAFVGAAVPLALLTLGIVVNGVFGVSELFLLIDRPAVNLLNTLLTIAINVTLNLLLIPRWGMIGASLAILIAYLFMNAVRMIQVKLFYKLQPFTAYHLRAVVALLFSAAAVAALRAAFPFQGPWIDLGLALSFLAADFALLSALGLASDEKKVIQRGLQFFTR